MRNRVTVNIAGQAYTILSEDDENHIKKVADIVDKEIEAILRAANISQMEAAVLAACNIADSKIKTNDALDNLRLQMKGYLDDAAALRTELAELRRENLNLKNKLER